jgi:hypothetical protein
MGADAGMTAALVVLLIAVAEVLSEVALLVLLAGATVAEV